MPRPRTKPITNPELAAVIRRTGATYAAFAQQVNTVAAENGYVTRYNRGSVANWLTGKTPTPRVIPFVVEAAARILGAPQLGSADLGWPDAGTAPPSPWAGDPATWLDHLGRCDMTDLDRRSILGAGVFTLTAAAIPAAAIPAEAVSSAEGTTPARAGAADAARIKEMTELFSDMDDRFGGGHARAAVAAYLSRHVVPMLRSASGPNRAALFAAAAEMAYLAGWMASDAGVSGLAQKYYIQSVRLAAESDDYRLKARTFRAMALQCVELGHPAHGRDIAEAAVRSLPTTAPPRLRSWCTAMRAEACAATGDTRTARGLLRIAERDLERATSSQSPDWSGSYYSHAALRHQTGTTLASAGDLAPAEEHLTASLIGRPDTQRRSRALIGTRLATLQVRRDQPDAAAQTVKSIHGDLKMVESARVDHELDRLRAGWSTARADPTVGQMDLAVANILQQRRKRGSA
ncbi:hypothetical protein [Spirillospora sp. CA-128828]|uniref:hypothetical protein n=1 Tax=Spirillospora sp. CA-128828 TaxID=3240033 RepID=UPI003D92407B